MPKRTNAAETLTNDNAIQWKVVNIDGTNEENTVKIEKLSTQDKYVRVVMNVDWRPTKYLQLQTGGYMIWDLNGHGLWFDGPCDIAVKNLEWLEITDTSDDGNGYLYNTTGTTALFDGLPRSALIISGGKLRGYINGAAGKTIIMTGGSFTAGDRENFPEIFHSMCNAVFADYIDTTDKSDYHAVDNSTHAGFAVSISDIVSGAYNSVYGAGWDLAAGNCILEKLTQKDTPYYLWYRNSDSEPYQLLTRLVWSGNRAG